MNSNTNEHSARVLISNTKGLHARASALFVNCAQQFNAEITVSRDGETVSGVSIMDLLMLAASKGTTITLTASGPQAKEAIEQLVKLVEARFHEDE